SYLSAAPATSSFCILSLRDALPISDEAGAMDTRFRINDLLVRLNGLDLNGEFVDIREINLNGSDSRVFFGQTEKTVQTADTASGDRKSTRLNSSHVKSSYAVFCLKK